MNGRFRYLGPEGYGTYEVRTEGELTFERVDKSSDRLLLPGFVDIHFHGAYGLDFMTATREDLEFLGRKLSKEGYEAVLMTTVTAPLEDVVRAVENLPDDPMFAGFHLEGPFISKHYPGAQPPQFILDPPAAASEWDAIFDHPKLRVVTMAAEHPFALPLITRLMSRGVIVSQGHTNATYAEAKAGFVHGAAHMTHFFNAMRPFHHREAGTVGYGLTTPGLTTEIIYDRQHVAEDAMKLLVQCKNSDDILAVSDSSAATRLPAGSELNMWGHQATVIGKRVQLPDGTLAGSTITLLDAFCNLCEDFGEELAIRACSLNPRRALKMGSPQVYLEFDQDYHLAQIYQLS